MLHCTRERAGALLQTREFPSNKPSRMRLPQPLDVPIGCTSLDGRRVSPVEWAARL